MVLGFATKRDIRDYESIYDVEICKAWEKFGVSLNESTDTKDSQQDDPPPTDFYDIGLDLSKMFEKEARKPADSHEPAAAKTRPEKKLPRYGFVSMLQDVFAMPDLLENNRFVSKSAAQSYISSHKPKKRVSFAKIEIQENQLPLCRRGSFQDIKFGHLHSPQCKNYRSEQSLSNQEFLIRGEFIQRNIIQPESEQDFFCYPEYPEETPVRPVPALPSILSTDNTGCSGKMDAKASTLDSINYHDKCNPGLRTPPSQFNFDPMAPAPLADRDSSAPATPYPRVEISFGEPLPRTCSSPAGATMKKSEFVPISEQKVLPMPCQPIISDEDIETLSVRTGRDELPRIVCDKTNKKAENSGHGTYPPTSTAKSSLTVSQSNKKRTVSSTSYDSGLGSLPSNFAEDFIDGLSSDSESEEEDEHVKTDVVSNHVTSESITLVSPDDERTTSCDAGSLHTEKPRSLDSSSLSPDSGFNSLSSDDENDEALDKYLEKVKRPVSRPKMWFVTVPSEKTEQSVEPSCADPEVEIVHSNEESEPSDAPSSIMTDSYLNPFSKKPSDSISLKGSPSTLGRMLCHRNVKRTLERSPEPDTDCYTFHEPSPDDVIKARQRLVGC